MESTHIGSHIVEFEPMFEHVVDYLRKLEEQGDPQVEDWFKKAKAKGKPKITDVPNLRSDKKFTLKHDSRNGRYFVEDYPAGGGWF